LTEIGPFAAIHVSKPLDYSVVKRPESNQEKVMTLLEELCAAEEPMQNSVGTDVIQDNPIP
jgi:hypothetical protein